MHHKRDVADCLREKDDNHDAHSQGEQRIHAAGGSYGAQIEQREQNDKRDSPRRIGHTGHDILRGRAAPDGADDRVKQIVHEHGPTNNIAQQRVQFLANIGVGGAGAGVNTGHAPIAEGGKEHSHHGDEDGGDHVAAGNIADHAVNAHGRRRLDDDNAIHHQMPQLERPAQPRLAIGSH